jgi:cellulose synthase/poly-beta-1,6-N-acetylglucosamine synthase-like glycosyltransferase
MNAWFNALVYTVWFVSTYYVVYFFLALYAYKGDLYETRRGNLAPRVTFLIPAYNEEASIADAIESMMKVTYRHIDFIILNDGSSDRTAQIVRSSIRGDRRFRFIDNRTNKGKAAVLNQGISLAKGELIACLDADSVVEPGIVQKVLPYFEDEKTGAVTVSVEVRNPKSFLHKIIAVEFALGLSLFLKVFSKLDCIFVTPGPFSMYRKKMLDEIGGYDVHNITEDHEIAFRIHKSGYSIRNCMEAKVFTTLPSSFRKIFVQRRRWYAGSIQTMFKHKNMFFRYGMFGKYLPFHYTLIGLGLLTFLASIYLSVSRFLQKILYYQYTGFNFFDHLRFEFDLLTFGRVNILSMSLMAATIALMITGLIVTHRRFRDHRLGILGYPFMFFLYQIYWGGAILAVMTNKRIKWR